VLGRRETFVFPSLMHVIATLIYPKILLTGAQSTVRTSLTIGRPGGSKCYVATKIIAKPLIFPEFIGICLINQNKLADYMSSHRTYLLSEVSLLTL
jgi:hypothetical protein